MRMFDERADRPVAAIDWLDAEAVPFSAEMGVSAQSARTAIRALATRSGYAAHTLIEWRDMDAPGVAHAETRQLCYAALLPNTVADDMPLGIGETAAEALGDLLWALGTPGLLAALADTDDPEPVWDDAMAEELAHSGLW